MVRRRIRIAETTVRFCLGPPKFMFIKSFFIIAVALPILIISTILIYFLNLSGNNPLPQNSNLPPSSQGQNTPGQNAPEKPLSIILSPHFDDAALSLGGLIARRESPALVVTFFSGEPEKVMRTVWDKRSGFPNSHEAAMTRFKENEQALVPLGAATKNYNYPDYQYREKSKDERVNWRALERIKSDIIKDIEGIIADNPKRELLIYGPADFGEKITHPDHQILHDALMEVAKKYSADPKTSFFIYEDFPYVRQFAQKNSEALKNYLSAKDNLRLEENFIELSEPQILEKIRVVSEYQSQIAAFKSMGSDILVLAKKFTSERCKTTSPQWSGCEAVYRIVPR